MYLVNLNFKMQSLRPNLSYDDNVLLVKENIIHIKYKLSQLIMKTLPLKILLTAIALILSIII